MNLGDVNVKKFGKNNDYLIRLKQKREATMNLYEIKKPINNLNAEINLGELKMLVLK